MKTKSWRGKNKYCSYFNLYIGSEWHKGFLLIISTILNYTIVIILIIPTIINNSHLFKIIIITIYTLLFLSTITLCILCVFGDPGILPINVLDVNLLYTNCEENSKNKRVNKQYVLRGRKYKMKFCRTCLIYRPLGCSHCKVCNLCIERYDHHCPWVGNCIGRNNYKYFYFYIMSFNLFCFFSIVLYAICGGVIAKCLNHCTSNYCNDVIKYNFFIDPNTNEVIKIVKKINYVKEYISFIFLSLNVFAFCFLIILFCFHTKYIFKNETTAFKSKYESENKIYGNPYNKGWKNNINLIICKGATNRNFSVYVHKSKDLRKEKKLDETVKALIDQGRERNNYIGISNYQNIHNIVNSKKSSSVMTTTSGNMHYHKNSKDITQNATNPNFDSNAITNRNMSHKSSSFNWNTYDTQNQNKMIIEEEIKKEEPEYGPIYDNNNNNDLHYIP